MNIEEVNGIMDLAVEELSMAQYYLMPESIEVQ